MKPTQPMSAATIRQIEFELEKAEYGMAMPYDAEHVAQLRSMLQTTHRQAAAVVAASLTCLRRGMNLAV